MTNKTVYFQNYGNDAKVGECSLVCLLPLEI